MCARCACLSHGGHRAPGTKEGQFLVPPPPPPATVCHSCAASLSERSRCPPALPCVLPAPRAPVPTDRPLSSSRLATRAESKLSGPSRPAGRRKKGSRVGIAIVLEALGGPGWGQGRGAVCPALMGQEGAMPLGHMACLSWLSTQAPGTHQPVQISLQTRHTQHLCPSSPRALPVSPSYFFSRSLETKRRKPGIR